MHFRKLGVDLEQDNEAAGFLGVSLDQENNTGWLDMKQTGSIQRVIEAVGLDNSMVKGKFTPLD